MDLNEAETLLRQAGSEADEALDLFRLAAAFAVHDLKALGEAIPLDPYQRHLDEMAAAIRSSLPDGGVDSNLVSRLNAMRQVVFRAENYCGDVESYESLQNANILSVMERRRGLPVALGLICMMLADRLGWQMQGLNFPGHFLLRFTVGREQAVLDPFDNLQERQPGELRLLIKAHLGPEAELRPEHSEAVSRRAVLLRLRNNTKMRLVEANDEQAALDCIEQMRWLEPKEPDLIREAAILNIRLGNIGGAIRALEDVAEAESDEIASAEAASMAAELRLKLN
jgi:regulator of sirC expression with transglutaminase-like and TPR domain